MTVFKFSLPDDLMVQLSEKAKELNLQKSKIIENALAIYLDQLNRAAYENSFQKMDNHKDIIAIAEEGMESYMQQMEF